MTIIPGPVQNEYNRVRARAKRQVPSAGRREIAGALLRARRVERVGDVENVAVLSSG